jgi:hypothetical protein
VPYFDLIILVGIVGIVVAWFFFRSQVQGLPVNITWMFGNRTALRFRGEEDLQGVFLKVKNARGKVIETIKKRGIPLDVKNIDRNDMKVYLIDEPDASQESGVKGRVYLDVAYSKMKHSREYYTREGTGTTIDMLTIGTSGNGKPSPEEVADAGSAVVLHDEQSAFKAWLRDMAEAAKRDMTTILIFMGAGASMGLAVTLVLLIFTGHFR